MPSESPSPAWTVDRKTSVLVPLPDEKLALRAVAPTVRPIVGVPVAATGSLKLTAKSRFCPVR